MFGSPHVRPWAGHLVTVAVALTVVPCAATPALRPPAAPPSVAAGGWVTVAARVTGDAAPVVCDLTTSARLRAPRSSRRVGPDGTVAWRWRVPTVTATGRYRASIRCDTAVLHTTVRVTPPMVVPRLTGTEFVERPVTAEPDDRSYAYLVRVRNPRRDLELLDVEIHVELLDGLGRAVTARDALVERIPAATTVLTGDQITLVGGEQPVRARVTTGAARGRSPSRPAPQVQDVRLVRDPDGSEVRVRGQVVNTTFFPMRPGDLTIALRDDRRRLIDVGTALIDTALPPGAGVAFDEGFFGAGYVGVSSVEVGVDGGR